MYSFRIEQAIRAAAVLHKDQVRRGQMPFPYITHLVSVAFILRDYTESEDVIVAALLHDAIEDTDYTLEELQEDFGGTVRDIVEVLTEPAGDTAEPVPWKEKKRSYIKQLRSGPEAATMIMAADKIHNMRSGVEAYYDDHDRFLRDFGGSLTDRVAQYEDLAQLVTKRLRGGIVDEFEHVFTEYKQFIHHVQVTRDSI